MGALLLSRSQDSVCKDTFLPGIVRLDRIVDNQIVRKRLELLNQVRTKARDELSYLSIGIEARIRISGWFVDILESQFKGIRILKTGKW